MKKEVTQDMIKNTVTIEMSREDFVKSVGLEKYKGNVKSVDASTSTWDTDKGVTITVIFEIEDKLKQIDFTKTIKTNKLL